MSRLIDELKKADRASYQPMGFKMSRDTATGPRLRLIASTGLKTGIPVESVNGADAVLLLAEKTLPAIKVVNSAIEQFKDTPWGIYLKDTANSKAPSLIKGGSDFVIFPADTPVSAIPVDDETGRIMEVDSSLDDGLLRAINNLQVDAVLLADSLEADITLVWHRLMIFQHVTNLLTKPVIIRVPLDAAESDIKALWEAGADGVIAKIDVQKPDGIKNLRKLIDSLPPRALPKKGSSEALLPYPREAKITEPEPEEEEEDW
jgi:hypothetical protein